MRICVFCGSKCGIDPVYEEAARAFGDALARYGRGLVYGGGNIGLMGIIADAALAANGEVIGVIPAALAELEVAHPNLTKLHVVRTMHERKALMASLSDSFVALPGGYGTLDELFEILTWAQLGIHGKPVAMLNVGGFFTPLLEFLDRQVKAGFVKQHHRDLLMVELTCERMLARLDEAMMHQRPELPKKVGR